MDVFWRDCKYALRNLLRRPAYTAVAILTLALGIGSNGAIFSLVNAVLLRPLPVENPDSLVRLYIKSGEHTQRRVTYPDYSDLKNQSSFTDAILTNLTAASIEIDGYSSQQVLGEIVTANYFVVLGITPSLGRGFGAVEESAGALPAVIISDRLWKRMFQQNPAAVGKTIRLNHDVFTIIGIAPQKFSGTFGGAFIDFWVPLKQVNWLGTNVTAERSEPMFQMIARLKDGVSREEAAATASVVARRLEQIFPAPSGLKRTGAELVPATLLHGGLRKGASMFLSLMMAVVALVLLTACANLANLILIAATGRRREMAIRMALGAGRLAIARQFVSENLLVSICGGVAGLFLSVWSGQILMRLNPVPTAPIEFDLMPDIRVLVFLALISITAGLILGMIPVLQFFRKDLLAVLQADSGKTAGGVHSSRMRSIFVVCQIAASLVLLIGAALFLQSLRNARSMDPGFDAKQALALDFDLKTKAFSETEGRQFYRELLDRISALPSVESASLMDLAPLDVATDRLGILIEGFESGGGEKVIMTSTNRVSPGYFDAIEIKLIRGRLLENRDDEGSPPVAVINQAMAEKYWRGKDPIGRTFMLSSTKMNVSVIGVVRNVKYRTIAQDPEPHFYLPFAQNYSPSMSLLVRTSVDPALMLETIQREGRSVRHGVQGFFGRTLVQHTGFALLPARLASIMSAVFGFIALMLSILGIYGTVGYSVAQRFKEIGIRLALGAQRVEIMKWILGHGLKLVAAGIVAGLVAAFLLTRLAAGFLYGISPADPLTFAGSTILLIALALGISYLPARHAMNVDPVIALKQE